jgi:hypothetical protein
MITDEQKSTLMRAGFTLRQIHTMGVKFDALFNTSLWVPPKAMTSTGLKCDKCGHVHGSSKGGA